MKKEKIFKKLEDLGFESEEWKNMDNQTIKNIIKEEREVILYPSFFNYECLGDIGLQDKPKKFVYFQKTILFYEDSEFETYEEYINYLDKVSDVVQEIKNSSIPCVGIENNNSDFHFLGFLFIEK